MDTHSALVCKHLYCLLTFGGGRTFAVILNICLLCQTWKNTANPVIYGVLVFERERKLIHVSYSFLLAVTVMDYMYKWIQAFYHVLYDV